MDSKKGTTIEGLQLIIVPCALNSIPIFFITITGS